MLSQLDASILRSLHFLEDHKGYTHHGYIQQINVIKNMWFLALVAMLASFLVVSCQPILMKAWLCRRLKEDDEFQMGQSFFWAMNRVGVWWANFMQAVKSKEGMSQRPFFQLEGGSPSLISPDFGDSLTQDPDATRPRHPCNIVGACHPSSFSHSFTNPIWNHYFLLPSLGLSILCVWLLVILIDKYSVPANWVYQIAGRSILNNPRQFHQVLLGFTIKCGIY